MQDVILCRECMKKVRNNVDPIMLFGGNPDMGGTA
jgi:hypothetical protein